MSDQTDENKHEKPDVVVNLQVVRNVRTLLDFAEKRAAMIKNVEAAYPGLWLRTENEVLREMLETQRKTHYEQNDADSRLSGKFNKASMMIGGLMGVSMGLSIGTTQTPETVSMLANGALAGAMAVTAGLGLYAWNHFRQRKAPAIPDIFEQTRQRVLRKIEPPQP